MDLLLDAVEGRVLGSLLEKERTVPATYPLTLKALVSACNQSSSREPVMDLSEAQAVAALDSLRAQGLVRKVLPTPGTRVTKYRQVAQDELTVDDPQRAVVTLLLLRGPQTPQELKARSDRLHPFADADEVRETLEDMAGWGAPLVRLLPRLSGQRDARWAHLLSGEPAVDDRGEPGSGAALGATAPTGAGSSTSAGGAPAAPPVEPEWHGPLAALVGTWTGSGEGHYPTVSPFAYTEELVITPMPGKPRLTWRVSTRAADDGRGLHAESGFLRILGDGAVELAVAMGSGVVEADSGIVEVTATGVELELASDAVAGAATAKEVTATTRSYRVEGDVLTYDLSMAAVGQPLTHHLRATLHRR